MTYTLPDELTPIRMEPKFAERGRFEVDNDTSVDALINFLTKFKGGTVCAAGFVDSTGAALYCDRKTQHESMSKYLIRAYSRRLSIASEIASRVGYYDSSSEEVIALTEVLREQQRHIEEALTTDEGTDND